MRGISRARVVATLSVLLVVAAVSDASALIYGLKSFAPAGQPSAPPTWLFSLADDGSAFTAIGPVRVGGNDIDADALAWSPVHGLLGFQLDGSSRLISIDPATAAATVIGPLLARDIRGAAFDARGALRVLDAANDEVLVVDPTTGTVAGAPVRLTLDGAPYDLHDGCDLAVRSDGRLYVISFSAALNRPERFTLDPDTGALTLVFVDATVDAADPASAANFYPGAAFARGARPDRLVVYEANNLDDLFRYDVDLGAGSRTKLQQNIIGAFNSGRGDLASLPPERVPSGRFSVRLACPTTVRKGETFTVGATFENDTASARAVTRGAVGMHVGEAQVLGPHAVDLSLLVPPAGPTGPGSASTSVTVVMPRQARPSSYVTLGLGFLGTAGPDGRRKRLGAGECPIEVVR